MTDNEIVQKKFINKSYVEMYLSRTGYYKKNIKDDHLYICCNCKKRIEKDEVRHIERGIKKKRGYLVCIECYNRLEGKKDKESIKKWNDEDCV